MTQGLNGSIDVTGNVITLVKFGPDKQALTSRTYVASELTGVDFQYAQFLEPGHIRFLHPSRTPKAIMRSMRDDLDALTFSEKMNVDFGNLYSVCMSLIVGEHVPPPPIPHDAYRSGKVGLLIVGAVLAGIAAIAIVRASFGLE